MMKKMLTMLLALAMMLSTACAMADEIKLYKVDGGTETNEPLDLDSETSTYQAQLESGGVYRLKGEADYLIYFSKKPGDSGTDPVTLTLDGVTITSTGTALGTDHSLDVNLILKGTNTLTADGDGLNTNGSLSISAAAGGTLEVVATGKGIRSSGNVTISGGEVNVTQSGREGIYSYAGMEISGGTVNVTQSGGDGIFSPTGDVTISGGTVTVTQSSEYGIYSSAGHLTISGGTVNVTSADHAISGDTTFGTSGDVTISGGTVTAVSTGVDKNGILGRNVKISGEDTVVKATGCFAIGSSRNMNILSGTVVARSNGNGSGKVTAGLFSHAGHLTISGGKVTAEANYEKGRGIYCENGGAEISGGDVRIMGRVKSIHTAAGLKVDDALHSMGSSDGLSDWTPAAPEHVGDYQEAWFAPGVPVSFKLGGGEKTVRVPGNGTWLMPQPEMLGLTVPQGLAYTGVWMHNGAQYPIGARAPQISGGETFTMETVAVAGEDLPKTGDPSMLGAWALLLGASAMGMRLRRKNG